MRLYQCKEFLHGEGNNQKVRRKPTEWVKNIWEPHDWQRVTLNCLVVERKSVLYG